MRYLILLNLLLAFTVFGWQPVEDESLAGVWEGSGEGYVHKLYFNCNEKNIINKEIKGYIKEVMVKKTGNTTSILYFKSKEGYLYIWFEKEDVGNYEKSNTATYKICSTGNNIKLKFNLGVSTGYFVKILDN